MKVSRSLCPSRTFPLLVFMCLQFFHATQTTRPPGDNHVCKRVETYMDNVEVLVEEPVKMRRYEWCVGVPPRCTKFTTELRNRTKHEAVEKNRTVSECCAGFVEINSECVSECPANQPCPNMKCQDTKHCFCLAGYTGLHCNTTCPVGRWGSNCTSKCQCGETNGNKCHHLTGKCILLSTTALDLETTGTWSTIPITLLTTSLSEAVPATTKTLLEVPSENFNTKAPSLESITISNTPPTILTKLEDTLVNVFDPVLTKFAETPYGTSSVKVPPTVPANKESDQKSPSFPGFMAEIPPLKGLDDTGNEMILSQTTRKFAIDDDLIMRKIAPILEALPTTAPKFEIQKQFTISNAQIPKDLSPSSDALPKISETTNSATTLRTIPLEDKVPKVFSDISIPFQTTTKKASVDTDWIKKKMEIGLKAIENVFEPPTTKVMANNILDKSASSFVNAFENPVTVPYTLSIPPTTETTFGTKIKVIDKLNLQAEVEKSFKSVVSSVIEEFDRTTTTERSLYNVVKSLKEANSNIENHFTLPPTDVNQHSSDFDMKAVPTMTPIVTNEYKTYTTALIPKFPSANLPASPPFSYSTLSPMRNIPILPPVSKNSPDIPTLPPAPTYIQTPSPVPTFYHMPTNPTTLPQQPSLKPASPSPSSHAPTLPPVPLLPPMTTSPPYFLTVPPYIPTFSPLLIITPVQETTSLPRTFNLPDYPATYTNPTFEPKNGSSLSTKPTFPPPVNIYKVPIPRSPPVHIPVPPVTPSTYTDTAATVLLDRSLFELPQPTTFTPNTHHFNNSHSETQNVFTSPSLHPNLSFKYSSPTILHPAVSSIKPSQPSIQEPQDKRPLAPPPKEFPIETYLPTPIIKERQIDTLKAELPDESLVELRATLSPREVDTTDKPTPKPFNPELDKAIGVFENSLNDLMKSMEHFGMKKSNSLDPRSKGSRFQNDPLVRELTDLRLSPGVAIREDDNELMRDRNYHPTSVGMNLIYNPQGDEAVGGPIKSMHHLHSTDGPTDSRFRLTSSSVLPVTVSTLVLFLLLSAALACYVFHRRRKPRLPCETCADVVERSEDLNEKDSTASDAQPNSNFCRFVNPHSMQLLTELQESQYQSPPTPQPIYEEIQW